MKKSESLKNEIEQLKAQINTLAAPFNSKISALQSKRDAIIDPMIKRQRQMQDRLEEISEEENLAALKELFARVRADAKVMDDIATRSRFLDNLEYFAPGRSLDDVSMDVSELRTPKVPGLVIRGWSGWRRNFYAAWKEGGAMVGWFYVEPSKHPGDSNSVSADVAGKDIFESKHYDVPAPLRTWINHLRTVSGV